MMDEGSKPFIDKSRHQRRIKATLSLADQENVLCLIAHFEEGKQVISMVKPELFDGDYRTFAEGIYGHWAKYNKPPGDHTPICSMTFWRTRTIDAARHFRRILIQMLQLKETLNPQFVLDRIGEFVETQWLKHAITRTANLVFAGDKEGAMEVWRDWQSQIPKKERLVARTAASFERQKVRWSWRPFFLRQNVTLVTGMEGVGKTLVILIRQHG